jgi:hypothetical protein
MENKNEHNKVERLGEGKIRNIIVNADYEPGDLTLEIKWQQ